ncbi:TetR/AcrR family transcriptional regulator [Nocardioides sp. GXZ039]|uniref:TetR/AcrR family transcriptional regulator n=1 Tax=Nocardioides sp. GXZ039 TaxID=3136018 RepID=UPI0030F48AEE
MAQAPRPTARGRQTQDRIDAAAREVIASKGFLRMTVADIVKEADRSSASFYNYYDSKEDLLEAWAREFRDEARARAERAYDQRLTGRELVEASARAHWETYRAHLAEMVGVFQQAMINDEFARFWEELCAEAIAAIAGMVSRAQRHGYCPGVDPTLTASAIVSMLNMFCYEHLANGQASEVDDERCIATLTEMWYRAIYWKPDPSAEA